MAIQVSSALHALGTFPIDDRLLLTKAQMKAINEDLYPDQYLCICSEDHKVYIFDYTFEKLDTIGRFRPVEEFLNFETDEAKEQLDKAVAEIIKSGSETTKAAIDGTVEDKLAGTSADGGLVE